VRKALKVLAIMAALISPAPAFGATELDGFAVMAIYEAYCRPGSLSVGSLRWLNKTMKTYPEQERLAARSGDGYCYVCWWHVPVLREGEQ